MSQPVRCVSCAKHSAVEFHTVVMLLTLNTLIVISIPSPLSEMAESAVVLPRVAATFSTRWSLSVAVNGAAVVHA